jgi:hypothetical protein
MIDIKKLAAYMSSKESFSYITSSPNDEIKRQRIDELKAKFLTGNFAAAANFAAACDDGGNPDAIAYDDCSTFAEYSAKAREVSSFQRIKSLVSHSNVAASVKKYALQKNEIILRNKAKKAERDAQKKDNFVSHPNWF